MVTNFLFNELTWCPLSLINDKSIRSVNLLMWLDSDIEHPNYDYHSPCVTSSLFPDGIIYPDA